MTGAIRTIIVAWVMLLGLCATGNPACAQDRHETNADDRTRLEQLVADHVANDEVQSSRPQFEPDLPEFRQRERNPFFEAIANFFAWLFRTFGGVFKFMLYAAAAGAVLYALWHMFGDVIGLSFRRKPKPAGPEISDLRDDRPDRQQAAALLSEADRLAAEGRFAEAVHLLLFRSIEDLRQKRTGGVPHSLTAREIQSLSDLSQRARQALAPIIRIVESSFFGHRTVDRDGWQSARSAYESFAFGAVTG